jgi:ABC-2 type transport system ATP-binding protein
MDPIARRHAWELIASLRDNDTTVVLTTHNMDEAGARARAQRMCVDATPTDALCDRIGIMAGGRLRAVGDTATLKATYGSGRRVPCVVAVCMWTRSLPRRRLSS